MIIIYLLHLQVPSHLASHYVYHFMCQTGNQKLILHHEKFFVVTGYSDIQVSSFNTHMIIHVKGILYKGKS